MKIHSAEFIVGAAAPGQFPPPVLPEVAFVGKSNVGKSSLINALLNRKHLVKTSATPGKTREINFFLINGGFRFVDLPGYGFSRAPKDSKAAWEPLIRAYLGRQPCLRGLVLILDARHGPSALDRTIPPMLEELGLRFVAVANKTDKLKRAQLRPHLAELGKQLDMPSPPLPFSAKTRAGRDELWSLLADWLAEAPATAGRSA